MLSFMEELIDMRNTNLAGAVSGEHLGSGKMNCLLYCTKSQIRFIYNRVRFVQEGGEIREETYMNLKTK
jgi:hypothetical protein